MLTGPGRGAPLCHGDHEPRDRPPGQSALQGTRSAETPEGSMSAGLCVASPTCLATSPLLHGPPRQAPSPFALGPPPGCALRSPPRPLEACELKYQRDTWQRGLGDKVSAAAPNSGYRQVRHRRVTVGTSLPLFVPLSALVKWGRRGSRVWHRRSQSRSVRARPAPGQYGADCGFEPRPTAGFGSIR